jgi:O-antigen/teichoic acid export membrane protein
MSEARAPGDRHSVLSGVLRNLGWLLASRGVMAVLSLFYLAIVTRTLGVTGFGRFALITGAAQVITVFVSFQTWQIIVQNGMAALADEDDARLARLFRASALLDAASAVAGIALSAFILHFWAEELGIGATLARATLIFNIVQLLSIRSTPIGILRLRDRFSVAALAESVTPVTRLIGAVLVAIVHPTLQAFLMVWAAAELLTAITYWALLARTGDAALLRQNGGSLRQVVAENPAILRFAFSTNASTTLGLSGRQIPLLLVGALTGPAAAGGFRLAAQLAQAITKLSQMLARAAFPEIVRAVGSGGVSGFAPLLRRSMIAASAAGVVVFTIVAVMGAPVLRLVGGDAFVGAYPILLWLAAAGCVDLVTVGFEPVLMAAHRAGTAFFIRLAATICLFAVAFMFEPLLGAMGISVAVFFYALVAALLLGLALGRLIRSDRRVAVHSATPNP